MNKVYVLKYYWNQYDQLDGYTVAIWKSQPSFHDIKSWFETEPKDVDTPEHLAKFLGDYKDTPDAIYGKLFRGEEVQECELGGDRLKVVEEELL